MPGPVQASERRARGLDQVSVRQVMVHVQALELLEWERGRRQAICRAF
jgi:hypothetical protein